MTHAHAAAADWLLLATRAETAAERLAAQLEPLGHIAWDTEGAEKFPYSETVAEWNAAGFVAAIEAEDEAAAIAHIRGALAQGLPYGTLRAAIGEAALAHYADFGHCAIYTLKAGQLIERLGEEAAEPVLLALTRMLARATREERLPEFRFYARALTEWDGSAPRRRGHPISSDFRSTTRCGGPWPPRAGRPASCTTRSSAPPRSTSCTSTSRSSALVTMR